MYREVFFYFFFSFPPFPLGGKLIPSGRPETANRSSKQSGALLRDVPLVNCGVDMVVLQLLQPGNLSVSRLIFGLS